MRADPSTMPRSAPPGWVNSCMGLLLRTPGIQRVIGRAVALITFTGRRTGRKITTPVSYYRHGHEVIVLSKAVRTWWRNFESHPQVALRLRGRTYRGTARAQLGSAADVDDVMELLRGRRFDAKAYGLELDPGGYPRRSDVAAILPHLAVIRVRIDQ